jgi:hypothetical protein
MSGQGLIDEYGRVEKDVLIIRRTILYGETLVNLHVHCFIIKIIKNLWRGTSS